MEVFKLTDLLIELHMADEWLVGLDLHARNDRLRHCIDVVATAAEGYDRALRTGQPAKVGRAEDYYFGLIEAFEFLQVYRAFKDTSQSVIYPVLKRVLSGPSRPALESNRNSDGRNMMFELALAAEWKLRGANILIGEPDITLILPERSYAFECKRPLRESGIRACVKNGAAQIAGKLNSPTLFGVVAISVSRALDGGSNYFVAPGDEATGKELLQQQVDQVFFNNYHRWSSSWFEPNVLGVLLHAAIAAFLGGQFARATAQVLWLPRQGASSQDLKDAIDDLYR